MAHRKKQMNARVLLLICLVFCAFATVAVEAGFGCPLFDRKRCHNQCRSMRYRGGYCTNSLMANCNCYGCRSGFKPIIPIAPDRTPCLRMGGYSTKLFNRSCQCYR